MSYEINPTTVDAIIERDGKILLIKREKDPFKGNYALPGGFVDFGETVEDAVTREINEECQITATPIAILGVYSGRERDPRGPIISTVFVCEGTGKPIAADDAAAVEWVDVQQILNTSHSMAFDHHQIISDYTIWKNMKRDNTEYTTFWTGKRRE